MPEKKNQHFVPRCALKPFSLDGAGLAINVFNISHGLPIENAPVKNQCARNYLYGKGDASAEDLLTRLEWQYARIVSHLSDGGDVSAADEEWLRLFIAIQQRRTKSAISQMRELTHSMADKVFARAPEHRPDEINRTDAQMMHASLALAMEFLKYEADLKLAILANQTKIDFVICDHPAVLTNRFYFQRLNEQRFGVSSSGAMISMPLSPRLSLMAYDQNVYTMPNATGKARVDLTRIDDVYAMNQIQYLSADKNIYFRSWNDAERISSGVSALAKMRAQVGAFSQVLVRDYNHHGHGEVYRRGSTDEEANAKETIVTTSFRQPEPPNWPSVLKFRSKPRTFFDGSAVGHVRKADWLNPRE
jgi:hypothetical protein